MNFALKCITVVVSILVLAFFLSALFAAISQRSSQPSSNDIGYGRCIARVSEYHTEEFQQKWLATCKEMWKR